MTEDQAMGMLIGLAVGDALGTYLEFGSSREPEDYLRDYTEGGPWFPEYRFCDYHDIWKKKLIEMMDISV